MGRSNEACTSSGVKTADAVISAQSSLLHGLSLGAPDSGSLTVTVYDNATAASGTVLATYEVASGTTGLHVNFSSPVCANKGIYLDLGGTETGATAVVYFSVQ